MLLGTGVKDDRVCLGNFEGAVVEPGLRPVVLNLSLYFDWLLI